MTNMGDDLPKLQQAVVDNDIPRLGQLLATKLYDIEQLILCPKWTKGVKGTPLHFAAAYGNIPAADALLSATANINSKDNEDGSPVYWASAFCNDKMVSWLLEHGANIHQAKKNHSTCLHGAASSGSWIVADLLLKHIDVNIQYVDGRTALYNASRYGREQVVNFLLDYGADPQIRTKDGDTHLHTAARNGQVIVAEILLQRTEIDINHQSTNGYTALHSSSKRGYKKIVQLLLGYGADASIKTKKGETALEIAKYKGHTEVMQLIENSIRNGNRQREILLNPAVRRRRNSAGSSVTSSQATIDQRYDMHKSTTYRGVCVLVNNQDFSQSSLPMKNRDGTQVDKAKLWKAFATLGLNVHPYDNLKADGMRQRLSHYSGADHGQHRCFVFCIMSHGDEAKIFGVDGNFITPLEMTSGFTPAKCPSLKDKPKAFVIVACKGTGQLEVDDDSDDTDTETNDAIGIRPTSLTPPPSPQREITEETSPSVVDDPFHEKDFIALPGEDFIVAFSTIPGNVSYRNTRFGTLFVDCLVKNLKKYGEKNCFYEILRNTEKHLNKEVTSIGRKRYKQICYVSGTLTKQFILSGEGFKV